MESIELFAGAGGLAIGVDRAGFNTRLLVEWDRWACETIRHNQESQHLLPNTCLVHQADVRCVDWRNIGGNIALVSGGPPCQPFSLGGKHLARDDTRDMFPYAVKAVRELMPDAFLFENVKGLTRSAFRQYFEYIQLQLRFPTVEIKADEDWQRHHQRLARIAKQSKWGELSYQVSTNLVNAADYGVPQRRERVFIVGFRSDLRVDWKFPTRTHSAESLIYSQYVSGDYWERHKIRRPRGEQVKAASTLKKLASGEPKLLPWVTIRDALSDLPSPSRATRSGITNHIFQDGARPYPGHTGSPLDLPAKTLKAGDHGVPGGENMMILDNGSYRYFSVREAARIQTFPDEYEFQGSWTETMRQLGNAVPVLLASVVASSVKRALVNVSNLNSNALGTDGRRTKRERATRSIQSIRQGESRRERR